MSITGLPIDDELIDLGVGGETIERGPIDIGRSIRTRSSRASSAARASGDGRRALDTALIAGLAGVFLVNALIAVVQPSDFTRLVEHSQPDRWK